RQRALALPRHLVGLCPRIDVQAVELPSPVAPDQPVVARADAEHEVGVVVGVPLDDLEEAPHPRAFGQRVHDEVVHQVLAAVPPVLAIVPQLAQVLADRGVAPDLALPQVIELGALGESRDRLLLVGEVDAPGVAREQLLDLRAVLGRHDLGDPVRPRILGHFALPQCGLAKPWPARFNPMNNKARERCPRFFILTRASATSPACRCASRPTCSNAKSKARSRRSSKGPITAPVPTASSRASRATSSSSATAWRRCSVSRTAMSASAAATCKPNGSSASARRGGGSMASTATDTPTIPRSRTFLSATTPATPTPSTTTASSTCCARIRTPTGWIPRRSTRSRSGASARSAAAR